METASNPVPSRRRLLLAALAGSTGLLPGFARGAPATEAWRSSFAPYAGPLKPALDSGPLRVEGRWPQALQGSFYRIGPARRELGGLSMTHWFDGDGMVQAFRFRDGKVAHQGTLLSTPKLKAEEAAGRLLYSGFGQTLPDAQPSNGADKLNPSNINLLALPGSGELFTLWEAGSALKVDPRTLEARGFKTWSADTQGAPFSAHPRTAPDGTVWSFGYMPGSGQLLIYEIDPRGQLRRRHVMPAPQADMVHDFAITPRHLVFLLQPLLFAGQAGTGNLLAKYRWDAAAPLVVLLVDKADFQVKRFELPATGVFHIANAWEEGGTVQVRFVAQQDILGNMLQMQVDQPHTAGGPHHRTDWTRIQLDLATGRARMETTGIAAVEFPRAHPHRNGLPTQFTTMLQRSRAMDGRVEGYDTVLGLRGERLQRHAYGEGWIAEEHIYVAPKNDAGEGRGWVLGTAYHWPSERTKLSVFDATAIDAGPVAAVTLPYGLPLGLHGQFVPA